MRCVVLAVLLASVSKVTAQTPCTTDFLSSLPAGDVAWCAAERAPSLVAQTTIRYPEILLSANVEGEVVLEATIDTSGRVDFATVKVRRQTHEIFTNVVRASVRMWRFVPARIDGKPARARGLLRVDFLIPRHDSVPREEFVGPARETATGLEFALGWRTPTYDPPAAVDTTRLYGLIAAIVRGHGTGDGSRALCLEWWQSTERGEPPEALMDYLRDHGAPPRLPPSRCPPTYASMILHLDSLGRPVRPPPGAVDPQILTISELRPWTEDLFVFRYQVRVGSGGQSGGCQAQWNATMAEWRISCFGIRRFVN